MTRFGWSPQTRGPGIDRSHHLLERLLLSLAVCSQNIDRLKSWWGVDKLIKIKHLAQSRLLKLGSFLVSVQIMLLYTNPDERTYSVVLK